MPSVYDFRSKLCSLNRFHANVAIDNELKVYNQERPEERKKKHHRKKSNFKISVKSNRLSNTPNQELNVYSRISMSKTNFTEEYEKSIKNTWAWARNTKDESKYEHKVRMGINVNQKNKQVSYTQTHTATFWWLLLLLLVLCCCNRGNNRVKQICIPSRHNRGTAEKWNSDNWSKQHLYIEAEFHQLVPFPPKPHWMVCNSRATAEAAAAASSFCFKYAS